MTVVSDYRALLSNLSWTSQPGAAIVLTYSFSTAPTAYLASSNPTAAASFHAATEDEKTTVRTALNAWASISGLIFQEAARTPGDLAFGFYDLSTITGTGGEAGLGNYPSTGVYLDTNSRPQVYSNFLSQGGDVYFDNAYQTNAAYLSDFGHVAIHEIGHALGLKHPSDTAAAGTTYTLDSTLDTGTQTVMSYSGARSNTLGPLDVQAIQAIYGTKTGATHPFTETWDPTAEALTVTGSASIAQDLFGSGGNDVFYSLGPRDALAGGEGDDIFYLAGKPAGVNGGTGTDTVVTGLAYSAAGTPVQGSGANRFISLAAYSDFQKYINVAVLDFTNGIYTTATNTFVTYDAVPSPGTTNPDAYTWNAAAGGTWGTGAWTDTATTLTLLPPGPNNAATITGSSAPASPAAVAGIGNAASLTVKGYLSTSAALALGTLSIGNAAGLAVAAGARITVSGTATITQTPSQTALAVAANSTLQAATLSLAGTGALQYALGTGAPTITAAGTLEIGTSGSAAAGVITIDPGHAISGAGSLGAPIVNNGTILATGGALAVSRGLSGTGTLQIAASGTLVLAAAVSQAVTFAGTGGQLDLLNPASTLQPGTITGFTPGDTIEVLTPTAATTVTWNPATAILSLANAGGTVAQLKLAGTYATNAFQITTRPGGYADITLAAPDPLFDAAYYLAQNHDVAAAGIDPYQHYITNGWHEGRAPDAWFDSAYYLAQNPDVAAAGLNPMLHFEQYGWKEGRQPSLLFDDAKYLAANPDVKAAAIDPLQHFLQSGQAEGRATFLTGGTLAADPLVSAAYYDRQLGATLIPAGTAAAQQAAWSYDTTGWQKGLNPNALFDTAYYLAHNPDVAAAHIDPLLHFEQSGWKEGRDASAQFSTAKYLAAYADVRAAGLDPLLHYIAYGQTEGRTAFTV